MLSDTDKMPYGKYKGEDMADVPAAYLIWLYDNNKCTKEVEAYVSENLDVLQKEIDDA